MLSSPKHTSTTSHIPVEIIFSIIRWAENDLGTLHNLCLVSKILLYEAQRILYRNINISDDSYAHCSGWVIGFKRAIGLLETLAKHDSTLAKLPQHLFHRLISSGDSREASEYYWGLMNSSLRSMVNLKSLIITCIVPNFNLLEGCIFRLKVFGCDKSCSDLEGRRNVTRFLSSQPDLETLYVWRFLEWDESQPKDRELPKLRALTGDRSTIERILPGRSSVTSLTWIPSAVEDITSPPLKITPELQNIRVFTLGGYHRRPSIRHLIPFLPSLQVLRLYGDVQDISFADELDAVAKLPNLRIFIWTAGFATSVKWDRYVVGTRTWIQPELIQALFGKIKALDKVYIHTRTPETEEVYGSFPKTDLRGLQRYTCWDRNKTEVVEVDYQGAVLAHGVVAWYS